MASLCGKIEIEIEINASYVDFFNVFKSQTHQMTKITPGNIHHVEVHEGDWETEGSVKHWKYNLDGETMTLKEKVEKIDEENKIIIFQIIDGDLKNHYKTFKATLYAFAKNGKNYVRWSYDYEKAKQEIPTPHKYIELAHKVTTDIDSHLCKA